MEYFVLVKLAFLKLKNTLVLNKKCFTIVTGKCESIPFKMKSPKESCGRILRQTLKYPKRGNVKDYWEASFYRDLKKTNISSNLTAKFHHCFQSFTKKDIVCLSLSLLPPYPKICYTHTHFFSASSPVAFIEKIGKHWKWMGESK